MTKYLLIAYRLVLSVPLLAGGLVMALAMLLGNGPAAAAKLLDGLAHAVERSIS